MKHQKLEDIAALRAVVGYLGEKEQYGWWQSSFLGSSSNAFLVPVFGRTALLAQLTAITTAAAQLHDEYIGVGDTYHLFRLPEDLEQDIHAFFADPEHKQQLYALTKSREVAIAYLQGVMNPSQPGIGPTYLGSMETLRSGAAWSAAAAHYANAFAQGNRSYPYFADRT